MFVSAFQLKPKAHPKPQGKQKSFLEQKHKLMKEKVQAQYHFSLHLSHQLPYYLILLFLYISIYLYRYRYIDIFPPLTEQTAEFCINLTSKSFANPQCFSSWPHGQHLGMTKWAIIHFWPFITATHTVTSTASSQFSSGTLKFSKQSWQDR